MHGGRQPIAIYYDGACPRCVRDRARYERLCANTDESVQWMDITGRDAELYQLGIDPQAALQELHVRDCAGAIHRELAAYILLMSRVPALRPLAWLIGLAGVRPLLPWLYRTCVMHRLRASHRV